MAEERALETMLIDKQDAVMTVTLNRPDRLNAFTLAMMEDWFTVLDESDRDDSVRVVIVTGAGRAVARFPLSTLPKPSRPVWRKRGSSRVRFGPTPTTTGGSI